MITAAAVFDAWGSSLLGGVGGAAIAVSAVFVAQGLSDRRKAADHRQIAANNLMLEVSTLRDAALIAKAGLYGDYDMFPLRNVLLTTYRDLGSYPSYNIVDEFYSTVRELRSWLRHHRRNDDTSRGWDRWDRSTYDLIKGYRASLYEYSDAVLDALKGQPDAKELSSPRPSPPTRPPFLDEDRID